MHPTFNRPNRHIRVCMYVQGTCQSGAVFTDFIPLFCDFFAFSFLSLCCVIGHITRSQGTDMNRTSCVIVIVMSFICMREKLTTCVAPHRAASRNDLKINKEF